MLKNVCNCDASSNDFWKALCPSIESYANPTIIDNTKKAGPIYSGSFEIYNAKKHSVETVYIKEAIYNKPATIVIWSDGTKTVSKASKGDKYNKETGLIYCILKKLSTNSIDKLFDEWLPEQESMFDGPYHISLKDVRAKSK